MKNTPPSLNCLFLIQEVSESMRMWWKWHENTPKGMVFTSLAPSLMNFDVCCCLFEHHFGLTGRLAYFLKEILFSKENTYKHSTVVRMQRCDVLIIVSVFSEHLQQRKSDSWAWKHIKFYDEHFELCKMLHFCTFASENSVKYVKAASPLITPAFSWWQCAGTGLKHDFSLVKQHICCEQVLAKRAAAFFFRIYCHEPLTASHWRRETMFGCRCKSEQTLWGQSQPCSHSRCLRNGRFDRDALFPDKGISIQKQGWPASRESFMEGERAQQESGMWTGCECRLDRSPSRWAWKKGAQVSEVHMRPLGTMAVHSRVPVMLFLSLSVTRI